MGTRKDPVDGLLIPDPRIVDASYLAPNTSLTLTSSYMQSTPRPGIATPDQTGSRLAPRVTGALEAATDVRVLTSGMAGRELGVELGYRVTGESDSSWRGWNQPNVLMGTAPVAWSASVARPLFDAVTIPSTGQVVSIAAQGLGVPASKTWDPLTWEWTTGSSFGTASRSLALLCLPGTERVVATSWNGELSDAWYTDDAGTTWAQYSTHLEATGTTGRNTTRTRMAIAGSDIVLVSDTTNPDWMDQFVSTDLGMTFTLVATHSSFGEGVSAVSAGGKILVGYKQVTDFYPVIRTLGTPSASLADSTLTTINAVACDEIELVADPSGIVYAFIRTAEIIAVWMSGDNGATWVQFTQYLFAGSAGPNDYLTNFAGVHSAGYTLMLHNWVASTSTTDGSIGAMVLGGWSSRVQGTAQEDGLRDQKYRAAFGGDPAVTTDAATYNAIELPVAAGFTNTGSGGTSTLVDPQALSMTTAATNNYYFQATIANTTANMLVEMQVVSGGSVVTLDAGLRLTVADGVNDLTVSIRCSTLGFSLYDENAAAVVGTDAVVDMTTRIQISVDLSPSTCSVWYRRPGATIWTAGPTGALTSNTATPAAVGQVEFGHIATGTASTLWGLVCYTTHVITYDALNQNARSKPMTATPVPLPDLGAAGADVAYLSVVSGPGMVAESWSVVPRWDYPIAATIPTVSPSPSRPWRSTKINEQILTWDMGTDTHLGGAYGVAFLNVNFRTATFQVRGLASWITLGTYDGATGFVSVSYVIAGDTLTPFAGTLEGGRYLKENELAGGHVILDPGGTPKARTILSNTAGLWTDDATNLASIRLEGVDGTEAASGTLHIVAPSGILIIYPTIQHQRQYWRIQIDETATSMADDHYTAGIMCPMKLQPFGAESSWGQSQEYAANVSSTVTRSGTSFVREQGPVAGSWSMDWGEGTPLVSLRVDTDLDYVGISGGNKLATVKDTAWLLQGILEQTKGGEIPVIAVSQFPTVTSTITDPSLFLYGRMTGPISTTVEVGTIGESEVLRVDSITIEGIV